MVYFYIVETKKNIKIEKNVCFQYFNFGKLTNDSTLLPNNWSSEKNKFYEIINFSHLPHMLVHLSLLNAFVLCSPVR